MLLLLFTQSASSLHSVFKFPTYRFHNFIQYGRLVWLTGSHIPFIDLQKLPQLFDVDILLLPASLLILALVNLRLRL